ncbi:imm11 family protein [Pyxidicoccus sp. 3LFB2]
MGRYFDLTDNMRIRHRWHLRAPRDEQGQPVNPWQFFEGKKLEPQGTIRFPVNPTGQVLDFTLDSFATPVVHQRVVELFEHQRIQDVQFIPVQVEGHDGPYFILNTLRTIRCIDDARSGEVRYFTADDEEPDRVGQYRVVSGMRIDPTKPGDAHIFRPWGWNVALIVSEDLKDAMEAVGITGPKFEAV